MKVHLWAMTAFILLVMAMMAGNGSPVGAAIFLVVGMATVVLAEVMGGGGS